MRWPLRNQIVLPMVGVIVATLFAVSGLNAYFSVQSTQRRIENQLNQVAETLSDSSFPVTDTVLQKMRGLSGAEFVVMEGGSRLVSSSSPRSEFHGLEQHPGISADEASVFGNPIALGGNRYFHRALEVKLSSTAGRPATLHILYPEASYNEALRDAVRTPLVVGSGAIVLVVVLALGIASRVVRPLRRLERQVGRIAQGDFRAVPVPRRDDEIADLSRSINRMAAMLAKYEGEVRQNERLRTLGQLGGGIAHQIRNSVTGCWMAVELHERKCHVGDDQEGLAVAKRQLELMERYLQRFLGLGSSSDKPHVRTNLIDVVDSVLSLVSPTARHVDVQINWSPPQQPVVIEGDANLLEQMLVNLVLNAIEAASQAPASKDSLARRVNISLGSTDNRATLEIRDTGKGPAPEVQEQLFDPFVTEKPDGVGLGLSVAQEIVTAHRGSIQWKREHGLTCFIVQFPVMGAATVTEPNQSPSHNLLESGA